MLPITASLVLSLLPPRPPESHKGTFGTLLCLCGSLPYRGAALLAAEGALRRAHKRAPRVPQRGQHTARAKRGKPQQQRLYKFHAVSPHRICMRTRCALCMACPARRPGPGGPFG